MQPNNTKNAASWKVCSWMRDQLPPPERPSHPSCDICHWKPRDVLESSCNDKPNNHIFSREDNTARNGEKSKRRFQNAQ